MMQLYDLLQFLSTLEQLQPFPSTLYPVIQIDNHLVSDLNQHYKKNKKNLPCLPPVVQILWNHQPNILQCTVIRNRASIESVFQMKATLSPVLRLNRESLGMRLNNTHGNDYLALVAKTVCTSSSIHHIPTCFITTSSLQTTWTVFQALFVEDHQYKLLRFHSYRESCPSFSSGLCNGKDVTQSEIEYM